MADITYCGHKECPSWECKRHSTRIPVGVPVSVAMFDCPYMPGEGDMWDDLRRDLWDAVRENRRLKVSLKVARAERDVAREKLARITGEREAEWLKQEVSNDV